MYGIYCPYVICHLHISHNAPYLSPSAPPPPQIRGIRCIMGDVQVAFSRNKKGRLKYAAGKKMGIIENSFLFTTRENTCLQQISQYRVT